MVNLSGMRMFVVLFLLSASAAFADELEPSAVISGLEVPVQIGEPIVLSADKSTADTVLWYAPTLKVKKFPGPDGGLEDAVLCCWTAQPGKHKVVLFVAVGKRSAMTEIVVEVIGSGPLPPIPEPIRPVDPEIPVGKFGFGKIIAESVKSLKSRAKAKDLAENYRLVASQAGAGKYKTIPEILVATRDANNSVLMGDDKSEWTPVLAKLSDRCKELDQAGKLKTVDETVMAWLEIASAFDGVR